MKKTTNKRQGPRPGRRREGRPPDIRQDLQRSPLWSRPGFLIRRLNQIHYAMFLTECQEFSITPVQYGVLTVLAQRPDLDQGSVAAEVGIDRANAADVLRRLESQGLIRRSVGARDRRVRVARLTPKGKRLHAAMYGSMLRAQEKLLEPFSKEEKQLFMDLLVRLVEANNGYGRAVFRPI